jgi:outer membrane protein OmpA-like peptidoglycan-associated protein
MEGQDDPEANRSKVFELRETSDFYDAWLYRRRAGANPNRQQQNEIMREQNTLAQTQAEEPIPAATPIEELEEEADMSDIPEGISVDEAIAMATEKGMEIRNEQEMTDEEEHLGELDPNEVERWDTDTYNEYILYLDVTDSENGNKLEGIVEAIDPNVHRLLHNLKANKKQYLGVNKRTTQEVRFETDIFGYRRQLLDVNLESPESEAFADQVKQIGDTIKIDFELEPHRKGDIFTMYKVFFYPDAAIMKPTSRYELDKLLGMLKSNDNYHIRLIGHTNGGGVGKIVSLKEDDDNFFTVTDENIETFGSAKKLSEERALTMKRWLMTQGISEDRMEIKGMGGKMMLYEADDAVRAAKNVRVEVEILKD